MCSITGALRKTLFCLKEPFNGSGARKNWCISKIWNEFSSASYFGRFLKHYFRRSSFLLSIFLKKFILGNNLPKFHECFYFRLFTPFYLKTIITKPCHNPATSTNTHPLPNFFSLQRPFTSQNLAIPIFFDYYPPLLKSYSPASITNHILYHEPIKSPMFCLSAPPSFKFY